MIRSISFILLLTIYSFGFLHSQPDGSEKSERGVIIGNVQSNVGQKPIPGVTVQILNTKKGTFTNAEGKFSIRNIPPGMYSVRFSGVGYETYVKSDVFVTNAIPVEINIELAEKVIELQGAEVRASYFIKKVESLTSTQSFDAEEIKRAPGVQEDVIRATALLPGVATAGAGRNDLLVRGGAPFENLFIVDNIEIPNINHFGSQGSSGGPLSLINIDYVKNVSFSAGGFGAKYGDKVSSLTNITLRNGNEEKFGGKIVLSATGFGANIEGPIGSRGSYWFSVRRSYLDFIFKLAGFAFIPQYWDFAGRVSYKVATNDYLSFLTVAALDDVITDNSNDDNKFSNSKVAIPSQDQYFSGITWKHLFKNGFTTVTLGETFSVFSTFQKDSNLVDIFRNKSREGETTLKTDVDFQLSPKINLTFGNQLKYAPNLTYDVIVPGYMRTSSTGDTVGLYQDTTLKTYKNASYVSLSASFGKTKLTLGGRYDHYGFLEDKSYLSPRLSVIYQLNDVSAIILSSGRYYQAPSYIWLIGAPNQNLKAIRSDQFVLGYEHTPMEDIKVQLEVFYKVYDNYPARVYRPQAVLAPSGFDDISSDIPFGLEPLSSVATGFAQGIELFVQKKLSDLPFYGLMSISVSQSKFKSIEGIERYGSFDSRVIANLALGYLPGKNWELSGKFRLSTGLPTTPYFTQTDISKNQIAGQKDYSRYNDGERLPLYHAVDVRVDKRWIFKRFNLVTYIDIQNLYGRENVTGVKWNPRTKSEEYQTSFGVLPSIGISFEF